MAKRPLNLNWKELAPRISEGGLSGGSMELEVVNSSTRFAAGPTCEMEQKDGSPELLTDHQLDEKIQRARQLVDGLNLPDGGRKLRIRLKSLEEEKERRRLEKDSTSFEHFRQTNHPRSKDSLLVSASSSSSSSLPFFDASGKRFAKPDICTGSSGIAFDEELSLLNPAKLTEQNQFSGKPNERDSTGWSMSMGNSMSCIPSRASIGQAGNRKVVVASNSSLCPSHSLARSKQNDSDDMLDRRRSLRIQNSQNLAKRKVETVILLDEDDVEPVNKLSVEKEQIKRVESKIYYPSRNHPECVEICYSDMDCLAPCTYLSSPIMNFYIQYLQKMQSQTGKVRKDYQFFNTYFYNKMEEALSYKGNKDDDSFVKLRRWWKGINIFEKSFIFLPIHSDEHWSLVIICIPTKEDEQGPIILHLDSLGLHDSSLIFWNIERYLEKEWEHLKDGLSLPNFPISYRVWRQLPSKIKCRVIEVPQQNNPYDCGLFVLYFIQRFIEDAPERVRMKDLAMFGRKWFEPEEASGLREHLKRLLQNEFEGAGLVACDESP
ncbi:ubiquitin-like-specific protease 1D [Nymphaea colorata]|nr:ubiquitin-like-specific protease 1D [Nymphaea colorata]XP_031494322.1 ubiquitin-like-specific protease 1D [Nymphaea colorata]